MANGSMKNPSQNESKKCCVVCFDHHEGWCVFLFEVRVKLKKPVQNDSRFLNN